MNQPLQPAEYEPRKYFPTGAHKLPIYKGYTVDFRLKEFRIVPMNDLPEFIPFDSEQGDQLLVEMIKKNLLDEQTLDYLFPARSILEQLFNTNGNNQTKEEDHQ